MGTMNLPRPEALRLRTTAADLPRHRIPFGLREWSDSAPALAILIDGKTVDVNDSRAIADQIPLAGELPPETIVYVLPIAVALRRNPMRWLGTRQMRVSREARCEALLIRGYVGIRAGIEPLSKMDLTCAVSSLCSVTQQASQLSPTDQPLTP